MSDSIRKAAAKKRVRSFFRTEGAIKVDQLLAECLPAVAAAVEVDENLNEWDFARGWLDNRLDAGKVVKGELAS